MKIHNNNSSSLAGTASAYSLAYWYFLGGEILAKHTSDHQY
jgi:hypothetical protein